MLSLIKSSKFLTLTLLTFVLTHTFLCAFTYAATTKNLNTVLNCSFTTASLSNKALNRISSNMISVNKLSYWQHMTANPNEFGYLLSNQLNANSNSNADFNRYKLHAYELPSVSKKEKTQKSVENFCYNQQITLVKKLIHNKHQHANGIEANLSNHKLTFGNLASFTMRFQLDQSKNTVPDKSQLEQLLSKVLKGSAQVTNMLITNELITKLTAKLTAKLISANLHLKLMFYGEHHSDYKTPTIYGEANIVLAPSLLLPSPLQEAKLPKTKLLKNKPPTENKTWLELVIKPKELNTYWQQNWQETEVELKDIAEQKIKGFILVAETPSGKTLESLLTDLPKRDLLEGEELFIQNYIRLGMFKLNIKNKKI